MECDDLSRRWRGYYLTAYGIAVKHGFKGTEAEWLESLTGAQGESVELRYEQESQTLQWKYTGGESWQELLNVEDLQGAVVAETLKSVQEAKKAAQVAQKEAEDAAENGENAKEAAETAATSAAGAQANASKAAQEAAAWANQAQQSASDADSSRDAAETAAGSAKVSETNAKDSEISAAGSADTAEEARKAVEDMQVQAKTLDPGADATVEKSLENGVVKLLYGIPRGNDGARGEKGEQGNPYPYYDTIDQMIVAKDLADGTVAATLGYAEKGDGGGAKYVVREIAEGERPDGGSLVQLENGLVAEQLIQGALRVDTFGAHGNGRTDDTAAIQAAIRFAELCGISAVDFSPGKRYRINNRLAINGPISLFGNGAKLLSYVESGPFLVVSGTIEAENILSANVIATHGDESKVLVSTVLPHGFSTGDRIVIQSQRDALSEDSGDYWCGTPTANTKTCQYAEVLVVQKALSDTDIECTGSLVYPYYFADREPGVDTSTQPDQREHSTVRKANFVTGLVVENLTIECYGQGKTHTDNTMILHLCADSVLNNVRINKHGGHGRCFVFSNCLNCTFVNCVADATETVYESYMDSHAIDNHFTFASSWYCAAEGCVSYHAGQTFDATYANMGDAFDKVRCPTLFPAVRNCLVHGSVDSAATNHSGCLGCLYENSRFTNFARPLSVRSPSTIINGCTFAANRSGNSEPNDDDFAIIVSDPTAFGTRITNCMICADSGIQIRPGVSTLEDAPKRKKKGIIIEGNTFFSIKKRLVYVSASNTKWNYEGGVSSAPYSQYAIDSIDVTIRGNLFFNCGDESTSAIGIYCSGFSNGVAVEKNRFVSCRTTSSLIGFAVPNTDMRITDNFFTGCSALYAYNYVYELSRDDPRNAALDANYMARNVYARNTSTDRDFLVCNSVKGNINLFRNNATRCGSLYSNLDSTKDGYVGWYGDLRKGNEAITFVVAGDDSYKVDAAALYPVTDGEKSIGSANNRWKDIYVVNSPISTSDEGEKQDISDIPDEVLEAWGKVRCKLFRFRQAVNEKGESARNHIGLIAQDIQRAFTDAGLDAADYGLFCADVVPDGNGGEKTVLGVRYAEALALECAYIRRRLDLAGM